MSPFDRAHATSYLTSWGFVVCLLKAFQFDVQLTVHELNSGSTTNRASGVWGWQTWASRSSLRIVSRLLPLGTSTALSLVFSSASVDCSWPWTVWKWTSSGITSLMWFNLHSQGCPVHLLMYTPNSFSGARWNSHSIHTTGLGAVNTHWTQKMLTHCLIVTWTKNIPYIASQKPGVYHWMCENRLYRSLSLSWI